MDIEIPSAQFNIARLLNTMENMPCESIHGNLKLIQWKQDNGLDLLAPTLH